MRSTFYLHRPYLIKSDNYYMINELLFGEFSLFPKYTREGQFPDRRQRGFLGDGSPLRLFVRVIHRQRLSPDSLHSRV